jgi:propanol-preferring alcohol dehydrogenase
VADLSEEKLEQARSLGAELAVAADNAGKSLQKLMGGVDAAIVLTGSPPAVQQAFRSVKRTGTVVLVGLAPQNYELPIVDTVLKGIRIQGSYLGTRQDLEEVLRLGAAGTVQPHVERFPIAETPRLLDSLKQGKLLGRAVIQF